MIDVRRLARDVLGDGDAFLGRLVGEHRPRHRIADGVDAVDRGAAQGVDLDAPRRVEGEPSRFGLKSIGERPASDRDHQPVELEGLLLFPFPAGDLYAAAGGLRAGDPGAEPDVEPLGGEGRERGARDVPVRGGEEVVQRLQEGHFRPETRPYAAELDPDHPRPDDAQAPGHFRERERSLAVDDALAVRPRRGDLDGRRAGRDDDVAGREHLERLAPGRPDLDPAPGKQGARALEPLDAVLPEQAGDPPGQRLDHLVLSRLHRRDVDRGAFHPYPVGRQQVCEVAVVVGGVEEGLGGNAAHVQAGAAQRGPALRVPPPLDARGAEAQLGATDGGDVAAGGLRRSPRHRMLSWVAPAPGGALALARAAGALHGRLQTSSSRRAGSSIASLTATRKSTASRPSMMRWS